MASLSVAVSAVIGPIRIWVLYETIVNVDANANANVNADADADAIAVEA
jgi:hypothetical protein